jgi:hypothetical protein
MKEKIELYQLVSNVCVTLCKLSYYHDVLQSILACSVERCTGFGEMSSSAAVSTVSPQRLKLVSHHNRSSVQLNKQESTEGHRGNSLSCGNNYFNDLIMLKLKFKVIKMI